MSGAAAADDVISASQLTTRADMLLTTSQAVYGSGAAYAADFNKVLDALQAATGNVDALTQSFVAQQAQDMISSIRGVQDAISAAHNEIAALRRES